MNYETNQQLQFVIFSFLICLYLLQLYLSRIPNIHHELIKFTYVYNEFAADKAKRECNGRLDFSSIKYKPIYAAIENTQKTRVIDDTYS